MQESAGRVKLLYAPEKVMKDAIFSGSTRSVTRTAKRDEGLPAPRYVLRVFLRIASPALVLAATLGTGAIWGQDQLAGEWSPLHHEDFNERIPGPDLGDFAGLPINDSARAFAESWNASRLTLQEHQCRVHVSPYIYHGPLHLRI